MLFSKEANKKIPAKRQGFENIFHQASLVTKNPRPGTYVVA
jgi:hypothetical protein